MSVPISLSHLEDEACKNINSSKMNKNIVWSHPVTLLVTLLVTPSPILFKIGL